MTKIKEVKQKRYSIKGGIVKAEDVQAVGEYIDTIGLKDPKIILRHAKEDKDCPLNKYLDWDNKSAGEKWRLWQIRNIINHLEIKIVYEGKRTPIKAFYSISEVDEGKRYVRQDEAMATGSWREQIVQRALAEQYSWVERYKLFGELKPAIVFLKKFLKNNQKRRK